MSHSLSNIVLHIVFSTKHREPLIHEAIDHRLHLSLIEFAEDLRCPLLAIGNADDHIHLLNILARHVAVSQLVCRLKSLSSAWLKKETGLSTFRWQKGYAAFSVSPQNLYAVRRYVLNQRERHSMMSFDDELEALNQRCDSFGPTSMPSSVAARHR